MPPSEARQLKAGGIDVSSVHELKIFSEDDPNLLELSTEENRVICTRDADYVRMARADAQHAGIVFFREGSTQYRLHREKSAEYSQSKDFDRDEKPCRVSIASSLTAEESRG